jgi:hypothetical protein
MSEAGPKVTPKAEAHGALAADNGSPQPRPEHLFAQPREAAPAECRWYHVMDVPGVGITDGPWDLRGKFNAYIGGVSVVDRSVLDIGTASGFLSFEAERAGACEVVSFDIDTGARQHLLPFKDKLYYRDVQNGQRSEQPSSTVGKMHIGPRIVHSNRMPASFTVTSMTCRSHSGGSMW